MTDDIQETLARLRQEKMELQSRQNTAAADYLVAKKKMDDLNARMEDITNKIVKLEQSLRTDAP